MKRAIVELHKNGDSKTPKFSDCILEYFTRFLSVDVTCKLINHQLSIYKATDASGAVKLQHSPVCPIKLFAASGGKVAEKLNEDIPVAVSVIIESCDNHVLLTRRPSHMRTSPGVWVPPGGHLDRNETLFECGFREVLEETGLDISKSPIKIICLWENVYPIMLTFGTPKSHALIVYCHVKLDKTHSELIKIMKVDPEEVQAFTWLSSEAVSNLYTFSKGLFGKQFQVQPDGSIQEVDLEYKSMFNQLLWTTGQSFTGVQFALKTWLSLIKERSKY